MHLKTTNHFWEIIKQRVNIFGGQFHLIKLILNTLHYSHYIAKHVKKTFYIITVFE